MTRAALALAVLLAAVPAPAATEWRRFPAMGTSVEIAVRDEDPGRRRAALDAARLLFERLGRAWYPWREGSDLHRVNAALARGEAAPAPPELIEVLATARRLSCRSGGRFDPAIGGLVRLWGFDRPPPYDRPPPGPAAIRQWLAADAGADDLRLRPDTVASTNPAVQLDLGGIAKGVLVDRALALIRAEGVEHALVNAGGDLAVIGTARGRPWRAGIRRPRPEPGRGLLAGIELRPGEALFTSGDRERFRTAADGRRLGHVLDPRTGRPARDAQQASVIAASGTVADAAATALVVADADAWPRVAADMGVAHALWIDADGVAHADAGLARRLARAGSPEAAIRTDLPPAERKTCS